MKYGVGGVDTLQGCIFCHGICWEKLIPQVVEEKMRNQETCNNLN
jgi:hypothetical protein